jgi:hypothetical protein
MNYFCQNYFRLVAPRFATHFRFARRQFDDAGRDSVGNAAAEDRKGQYHEDGIGALEHERDIFEQCLDRIVAEGREELQQRHEGERARQHGQAETRRDRASPIRKCSG